MPQMQALSERIGAATVGSALVGFAPLSFHGLKTAVPDPNQLVGQRLVSMGRRAKYVWMEFEDATRVLFHLSQAGRLDIESPPKQTKPKGSVVRWNFGNDTALLLREFGTERKAGWWVLEGGDDGPLARLGPEPDSQAFAELVATSTDGRRIHTVLRDQRTVAGIGRGYADDILHRAELSPFATLKAMTTVQRDALIAAVAFVLTDGLARERTRTGGLSENKLGEHFAIHGHHQLPCPRCATELEHVSYESHEVVYCPKCQTNGRVLADRRMSRLLK